ncbi:MAG: Gfo/Idh/MocA family oxidoreductase, partial [Ignavibacteria bacterium]
MEKLKVGVIGTGHLGKLHLKMFKQIENCELVGIYDVNPEQADSAGTEYQTEV